MTERPGRSADERNRAEAKRQADLDWLYGRTGAPTPTPPPAGTPKPPVTPSAAPAPAPRPRVTSPGYDAAQGAGPAARHPSRPTERPAAKPSRTSTPGPGRTPRDEGVPARSRPATASQVRRRRRTPRPVRLLRGLLVLIVAVLVWLVAVPVHAYDKMAEVDESAVPERIPNQPGTAVLLIGNDRRADDPAELATRADTIMMLYRPTNGQSVLVSLPRDSFVNVPGVGATKLNASYAYGGPALLSQTVEEATGVRIDGYLEVGFDGFVKLVDAVGGIEVCVDAAMVDELSGLNLPAGCSQVAGDGALAYVRMRYSDPRGDIGRAERQREVIGKVVKKAATWQSVVNPKRYWDLNMAVSDMLTRGDETQVTDLAQAGLALLDISNGEGLSLVVPISDPAGWAPDGSSVVIWDSANALQLFDEISRGDTSQLARFAG